MRAGMMELRAHPRSLLKMGNIVVCICLPRFSFQFNNCRTQLPRILNMQISVQVKSRPGTNTSPERQKLLLNAARFRGENRLERKVVTASQLFVDLSLIRFKGGSIDNNLEASISDGRRFLECTGIPRQRCGS